MSMPPCHLLSLTILPAYTCTSYNYDYELKSEAESMRLIIPPLRCWRGWGIAGELMVSKMVRDGACTCTDA